VGEVVVALRLRVNGRLIGLFAWVSDWMGLELIEWMGKMA
jgi:hypothetical protein